MLLTVVSLVLLVVPCAPQTGEIGVVIGISPPKKCVSQKFAPQQWLVRQALYNSVNHLRRQLAKGVDVFPDIKYMRGARLMYAMRYSCELEQKAFAALQRNKNFDEYVTLKYKSKSEEKGKRDLTSYLVEASTHWKEKSGTAHSTFMYPYVPFMGCAYDYKLEEESTRFRLLCLFDRRDYALPRPQNLQPPCGKDDECNRFRDSTCQDSLCWGPETPYNIQ